MKKYSMSFWVFCFLPLSAVLVAFYCLTTYDLTVHNESSLTVCGFCIIAFIVSTIMYFFVNYQSRYSPLIYLGSIAVLAFVFYVGSKIPFCVVCEGITEEDLGFLSFWITPELPPQ